MNKSMNRFFIAVLTLALGCGMTACSSSDDDDVTYPHSATPEIEAQGTYSGTFTRIQANSSTAVPENGEGTLIITPSGTPYVANLRFECTALSIAAETPVNITFVGDGFMFSNNLESNPLGSPIAGRISAGRLAYSSFQLKIRQGRSTKTFDISFEGGIAGAAQ